MDRIVQIVTGLLSGTIFTTIAWVIFDKIFITPVADRPGLPYFIAIALNLFILRYLVRNNKEFTAAGLIISTFVIAILAFKFKL
jgi:hypothetical protein